MSWHHTSIPHVPIYTCTCSSAKLATPHESERLARSSPHLGSHDIEVVQASADKVADLCVEQLLILVALALHQLEDVEEEVEVLQPCPLVEELLLLSVCGDAWGKSRHGEGDVNISAYSTYTVAPPPSL